MLKKVLFITYYWPPSGGIGVLRCLKISKYLRQFGWEPIIYTAKDAHYPSLDPSNESDVHSSQEIIKGPIWEPYNIYKFLLGLPKSTNVNNVLYVDNQRASLMHKISIIIRSNLFIPDARSRWVQPSLRVLENYLKENHVDAIFSCGPPHTNTRIATLLSQRSGIPWHADFQDPWTQVDYYSKLKLSGYAHRKHLRMEKEAFKVAKSMSIVSSNWKRDLEGIGAKNVHVIPWGFDPDDYPSKIETISPHHFTIAHTGLIGLDRRPNVLMQVLKDLCDESEEFNKNLRLILVGQIDKVIEDDIKKMNLQDHVLNSGETTREQALNYTLSSCVNLLLLNKSNAPGRIPGKLFEYLASRRPILCLGEQGDSSDIIQKCKAGVTLDYEDYTTIKDKISSLFEEYSSGILFHPVKSSIAEYSSIHNAKKISDILHSIT